MATLATRALIFAAVFALQASLLTFVGVNLMPAAWFARSTSTPGTALDLIKRTLPEHGRWTDRYKFDEIARYFGPLDVLFLGSSQTFTTFDPRIFERHGLEVFNLGTAAQTPLTTYYLLEAWGDRFRPRLLVVDVYWGFMGPDGEIESILDLLQNARSSPHLLRMVAASNTIEAWIGLWFAAHRLSFYTPIGQSLRRFDKPVPIRPQKGIYYIPGGFFENPVVAPAGSLPRRRVRIDPEQLDYLRRIAAWAHVRNTPLIFIKTPVSPSYAASITNLADILSSIDRVVRESGHELVDYNTDRELVAGLEFRNADHLTSSGARVFCEHFVHDMRRRGLLPTSR
jgi:hypothetical protein